MARIELLQQLHRLALCHAYMSVYKPDFEKLYILIAFKTQGPETNDLACCFFSYTYK